jgi:hypothetical protein
VGEPVDFDLLASNVSLVSQSADDVIIFAAFGVVNAESRCDVAGLGPQGTV